MAGKKHTACVSPGKGSQSSLESELQMSSLPFVTLADSSRVLPRYTTILSRSADDGITVEDLDTLQQDLERLLSNAVIRARALKIEIETLDQTEHSKKGKTKPLSLKHKIQEAPKNGNGIFKKRVPVNPLVNNLAAKREVPKISYIKNDMSDKWWLSVEPYCADVAREDISFLDNLIKQCSEPTDVKIPLLGEHYFTKWVKDIGRQETSSSNASSSTKPRRGRPAANLKVDSFSGYLSQRLIAGLIEEDGSHTPGVKAEDLKSPDFSSFIGKGTSPNSTCIENTIRKELVEQGILDVDELPQVMEPDDHILQEIKKCAAELSVVNKFNLSELNRLRNTAVRDLQRQKVKASLAKVDKQVIDISNKLFIAKQNLGMSPPDVADSSNIELEREALRVLEQQATLHKELMKLTDEVSVK